MGGEEDQKEGQCMEGACSQLDAHRL
jgi:hypothetical protein